VAKGHFARDCANRRQRQADRNATPNVEFRAGQGKVNEPTPRTRQNVVHGRRSTEQALKLATDGRDNSARHPYFTKDAARNKKSGYLNGVPIVRAVIGRPRTVLVDTGSSISLIQPGICTSEITRESVTSFGVTGDELRVKGIQRVIVIINGETYTHEFCVCDLATEADAIVGRDFLKKMDATLDFEKGTVWLKTAGKVYHGPLRERRWESRRTSARAALSLHPRRRLWQARIQ